VEACERCQGSLLDDGPHLGRELGEGGKSAIV